MDNTFDFGEVDVNAINEVWEELGKLFSVDKEEVEEEATKTFEDALDMCDVEIQERYSYLDSLLCELDDEMLETYKEIEYAKVDEEICKRLIESDFDDKKEELVHIQKRLNRLTEKLDYLQVKYDITDDLYEEMFLSILANLD